MPIVSGTFAVVLWWSMVRLATSVDIQLQSRELDNWTEFRHGSSTLWAVGVQLLLVAHGSCGEVLGTVGSSAL